MNTAVTSARVLKRILYDIAEIQKSNLAGISLCMPDTTKPFTLHGNVIINEGAYKDILVHLIVQIPQDYPLNPPAVNVAPGHPFGHTYHHHVYDDPTSGNSICIDLTSNFGFGLAETTGWTPAYTLQSLLMQLQTFFADPDYPEDMLPSKEKVAELRQKVRDYTLEIQLNDGENSSVVTHSHESPYPPVRGYSKNSDAKRVLAEKTLTGENNLSHKNGEEYKNGDENQKAGTTQKNREEVTCQWGKPLKKITKTASKTVTNPEKVKIEVSSAKPVNTETLSVGSTASNSGDSDNKDSSPVKSIKEPVKKIIAVPKISNKEISNKLTCSITKTDILDSSEPILGYPISFSAGRFGEVTFRPIMEILSYEAFMLNFPDGLPKDKVNVDSRFLSGTAQYYSFWLPVYINDAHFQRSKEHIYKAIHLIHNTLGGEVQAEFDPEMTLRVLPPILTKIMTEFIEGNLHQSTAAMEAYSQFSYLFAKLTETFPAIREAIDYEVQQFYLHEKYRTIHTTGDLGEFIVKLALSSEGINNPGMINLMLKEHLARQVTPACKRDKGLRSPQQCKNFVSRFMSATSSANQFLMLQIETAKLFLSELVMSELEVNYGLPSEKQVRLFKMRFDRIRSTVAGNWSVFIEGIKQDLFIMDEKVMTKYLLNSYNGYNKNFIGTRI